MKHGGIVWQLSALEGYYAVQYHLTGDERLRDIYYRLMMIVVNTRMAMEGWFAFRYYGQRAGGME